MSARLANGDRMTVEQFLAWAEQQTEGRYELVDGVPRKMSPERNIHAVVKGSVYTAFRDAVRQAGLDLSVFVDGPAIVTGVRQTREPDVVVHPRDTIDWNAMTLDRPVILVEVLSPSSIRADTREKRAEYFSLASVEHYLVVDPSSRSVTHHRRSEEQRFGMDGELRFDPPGFGVTVATFFDDLPHGTAS